MIAMIENNRIESRELNLHTKLTSLIQKNAHFFQIEVLKIRYKSQTRTMTNFILNQPISMS